MKFPYLNPTFKKEQENTHFHFRHIDHLKNTSKSVAIEVSQSENGSGHSFKNHTKVTFQYNDYGKISTMVYLYGHPDTPTETITHYEYDASQNLIRINNNPYYHRYDQKGNLEQILWDNGLTGYRFFYDEMNRIVKMTLTENGETEAYSCYAYDLSDRIVSIKEYGFPEDEIAEYRDKGIVLKNSISLQYTETDDLLTICLYENWDLIDDCIERERFIIDSDGNIAKREYLNANGTIRNAIQYSYTYDQDLTLIEIEETIIPYHNQSEGNISSRHKITYAYEK